MGARRLVGPRLRRNIGFVTLPGGPAPAFTDVLMQTIRQELLHQARGQSR